MTTEEFILSRSYLPKDGTYTMLDHIKAMMMSITGTNTGDIIVGKEEIDISIDENVMTLEVKPDIINIIIEPISEDTVVQETYDNVKVIK